MYTIDKHKSIKMANIKQNRFLIIANTKEQIFYINDLARIWGINNHRNLAVTLSRYVAAGLIYRIHRGLYSLKKASELDPVELGFKVIGDYSYLSGETVLAKHGVIFQRINYFTFIGRKTKRFQIGANKYYCRQLKESCLYNNTGVIKNEKSFNEASLERAVADTLYFNSHYHFDNLTVIDEVKLQRIQRSVYNN